MPNLDAILADSLLFNADAGNPAPQRVPLGDTMHLELSPATTPGTAPESQAIWSWVYDPSDAAAVIDVGCNVRSMDHHTIPVFERVAWERIQVEDPLTGQMVTVPVDGIQRARGYYIPSGRVEGTHPMWLLPANVDASMLLVFAGEQDPNDRGNFLPLPEAELSADDFMPPPGAARHDRPLRVVVCCELVLCKERDDFEPMGVLGAARVNPHLMIMTDRPVAKASATVSLRRPSHSGMNDPHLTPEINTGLWADTNDNSQRLGAIMQALHTYLPGVAAGKDLPLWDNIFDYYRLDPSPGSTFTVLDPAKAKRLISDGIEILDLLPGSYRSVSFEKWPGQGAYDNLHMAPKMISGTPAAGPDPVTMAPVCLHDCLHLHWRWGGMWGQPGMEALPNSVALKGWDAGGRPYTEDGAPMTPLNQRVDITVDSPSAIRYRAIIHGIDAGSWQHVFHHGAAYAVSPAGPLELVKVTVPVLNILATTILGLPPLSVDVVTWDAQTWAVFYSLLRFQPYLLGPAKERIKIVNSASAES